jgi:hypothetical protein
MKVYADITAHNVNVKHKGIVIYVKDDKNRKVGDLVVSKGGVRWVSRFARKGKFKGWGSVRSWFEDK